MAKKEMTYKKGGLVNPSAQYNNMYDLGGILTSTATGAIGGIGGGPIGALIGGATGLIGGLIGSKK
jgi:hypothetical protein